MSASLVGSEMCIRDSPSAPLPRGQDSHRVTWPRAGGWRAPIAQQGSRGRCLLYTSDAADDM
eukprot:11292277-Alexandrium_andersonii.AAC.1